MFMHSFINGIFYHSCLQLDSTLSSIEQLGTKNQTLPYHYLPCGTLCHLVVPCAYLVVHTATLRLPCGALRYLVPTLRYLVRPSTRNKCQISIFRQRRWHQTTNKKIIYSVSDCFLKIKQASQTPYLERTA